MNGLKIQVIFVATLLFAAILSAPLAQAQQIVIPRIEQMPNMPQPYEMRDWKAVARGYDSLVYDFSQEGEYFPLIFWNPNPVNYPGHASFGLETVVGTPRINSAEGINVLPSVIGATLAGIDKSDQDGENWVLMCEEFFNNRPEENIYLNNWVGNSGSDWWYDTMPNIFFYQLNDLYPGTGDFDYQFSTIANQWLAAVKVMGGTATPWHMAYMRYKAFSFSTMEPVQGDWTEPEAAGAIAWILYMAYTQTGNEEYRLGAEWAMEFLDSRTTNPSYELQLPYGTMIAARMNAEQGTLYDLEQLVNWNFEIGPIRHWGAIVGTWGDYDVSGLIGEVFGNDYAFLMNGFEHAGALLPLVRYDDRYTRAMAKWILNLANASRLFYPNYLPEQNQDSEEWSYEYDPNSYIGHEAMREEWNGQSPFATGDAVAGGWGYTNLVLYGSSHVGVLAGIVDTTNVEGILKLDARSTDYYQDNAYPTFVFYNPHDNTESVLFDVGVNPVDLYETTENSYIATSVTGTYNLEIPSDQALLVVLVPAGGAVTYELNTMLVNGVPVDYVAGQNVDNYPPRIKALASEFEMVPLNGETTLYCTAEDLESNELNYDWLSAQGEIVGTGHEVTWTPPAQTGTYEIVCMVDDGNGGQDSTAIMIPVVEGFPPEIHSLTANPPVIAEGGHTRITCNATDPDQDSLSYSWSALNGWFGGEGASVNWWAPDWRGLFTVECTVTDGYFNITESIDVVVGDIVGWYYMTGDATDLSGFQNHGFIQGPVLTSDRYGSAECAFYFDGGDDRISVSNNTSLNFTEAITVNFWMKADQLPDRESFPISHGSWQNRWKVSIIPDGNLRWTVNTENGIFDLDAPQDVEPEVWTNVVVTYGEGEAKLYLDGELQNSRTWSGSMRQTSHDLTIGQMLPGDANYNFAGVLDDIRIYNRVLDDSEIVDLYEMAVEDDQGGVKPLPTCYALHSPYPNPFNSTTLIKYQLPEPGTVQLDVFNLLGQHVQTLLSGNQEAGYHTAKWKTADTASGVYLVRLEAGAYSHVEKVILLR